MIDHAATPSRAHLRQSTGASQAAAGIAAIATAAAIIGLFAISPVTLEHFGFAYYVSGGNAFSKVHPSTFFAGLALALRCLAAPHPLRSTYRLLSNDAGAVMLLMATAFMVFVAIFIAHTPVTGLIDTFVLPVVCFILLRDLDPRIIRVIAMVVGVLFCINAVMAIYELVNHVHLITVDVPDGVTSDPTRTDAVFDWRAEFAADWRAAGLLGHPLVNGLIVGCLILCLLAPGAAWLSLWARLTLVVTQSVSMIAFGARTSLVLTVVFATLLVTQQSLAHLRLRGRFTPKQIASFICVLGLIVASGSILYETGFLDRTIERFADDGGSANTRLTMFELFDHISWTDLMLAPDPDVVSTWTRILGLEFGVESSWAGLALTYGLIVTAAVMIALLAFAVSIVREAGPGSVFVLLFYFISVSVTASMSGKTTTFAMVIALILLFLPRRRRIAVPAFFN